MLANVAKRLFWLKTTAEKRESERRGVGRVRGQKPESTAGSRLLQEQEQGIARPYSASRSTCT